MNVIYCKEKRGDPKRLSRKTHDSFSSNSRSSSTQDSLASGDGDCVRCCRLCGGDTMLKYFRDTYVWEGVEERYDQLLYDCFGVKVTSSDCMICDWCVRALRGTEKFRALVHAAFSPTASKSDMDIDTDASSTLITIKTNSCQTTNIASDKTTGQDKQEQPMINKKVDTRKKRPVKKYNGRQDTMNKKVIVNCELCHQRYPMMPSKDGKSFTCSRCKKSKEMKNTACRKCNIVMPLNLLKDHMAIHAKAEVRATSRLMQNKKLLHSSRTKILVIPKGKAQNQKDLKKHFTSTLQAHDEYKDCNRTFTYEQDLSPKQQEGSSYQASLQRVSVHIRSLK